MKQPRIPLPDRPLRRAATAQEREYQRTVDAAERRLREVIEAETGLSVPEEAVRPLRVAIRLTLAFGDPPAGRSSAREAG